MNQQNRHRKHYRNQKHWITYMYDMFGLFPPLATVVTTLTIVSHNTSHTPLQSTGSSQGNRKLSKPAGTLHNGY